MAGASKEKQLAHQIYLLLQAASCPLLDGLFLQEEDSMLQLLCLPSQYRTDILAWICSSINSNFQNTKAKDPEVLTKEMALLGQELMLCRATDLDLIRGVESPMRQLQLLKQLLALISSSTDTSGLKRDEELLLNELYSPENLPGLAQMLRPSLDPWPAHVRYGKVWQKGSKAKVSKEAAAPDLTALLLSTREALEALHSECEFLKDSPPESVFSSSALRVAASDLHQMMAAFSHVYDTDLKSHCSRAPPNFSPETCMFQRVHELMTACNTDLETLNELSEASGAMTGEVRHLQAQPRYWSRGEKRTLPDTLEELTRRYREFLSLLNP
ncbi:HAUS augmin-like complex subunit 7 [Eucyclogobius newberryi]|uniref:HAUS augmin-like complex subunit 7 n=1 Tax=Eucyclogobius newberryi TaxID=166745 RepID=UPI003B5A0FD4